MTLLCENECLEPDGKTPRLATHGRYCVRCWGRIDVPLSQAGELAAHLIGNVLPSSIADDDRVDGSRDAPLPLNQNAFDDASELYSMLVYWTDVFAKAISHPEPEHAAGSWRNGRGTIIGLPLNVSPEEGAKMVTTLTQWLRTRLDRILGTVDNDDDIQAFTEAIGGVWRMNARWPRVEKPSYSKMPCPREDCSAKIAVYPPSYPGDTRRVVCTSGHWYPEEEYEHLLLVFRDVRTQKAKAAKVAERLAAKYGPMSDPGGRLTV